MTALLPRKQRGLSLVELMVAVVIGLIAILVITQVAVTFQAQKRSTIGTAASMDEGAIALYTLRREVMGAGYGIIDPDLTACRVQAHEARPDTPATARDFSFSIYPVLIDQGVGGAPDTLTVNFSKSPMLATAAILIQNFPGDEMTALKLNTRYGFNPGDVIILADSPPQFPTPRDCSMYQVTALPDVAGEKDTLEHKLTEYTNLVNATVPSRFNKSGGLGITINGTVQAGQQFMANRTKVFNLGGDPASRAFSIQNNQLIFTDSLTGQSTVLLDNVITFQAQFGLDARPGAQLDMRIPAQNYQTADGGGFTDRLDIDALGNPIDADGSGTSGNAGDYLRVGAVRIAIVVRNKQPEIDPSGTCNVTTSVPAWSWGSVSLGALPSDWQCYKYKVFETVIPLRNMMWRPQS
jgi:type IV pilus assembly protein PilW